ncbi:transposase [Methylovulum psychrotolerans]|uniref:transposase n=1 Tax=Methylovulum psychrotolerans TaxID=1704499 RepID=UPI001E5A3563|nr:transposase [Methylovulum psychrotolerans]
METSIIIIKQLASKAHCYPTIRPLRWAGGITCPHCGGAARRRRKNRPPSAGSNARRKPSSGCPTTHNRPLSNPPIVNQTSKFD